MPEKIMKTLWDESTELEKDSLSTQSVATDDYASKDHDLEEISAEKVVEDDLDNCLA